jgi:hypothetical protein
MPLENVKDSLGKAYKAEHKDAFYVAQREAYDVLFPVTREVDAVNTDGLPLYMDTDGHCTTEQIGDRCRTTENIDYSEDLTFKTYEEYRDETIITQNYIEATYDEEGIVLTPAIPKVTEQVRPYIAPIQADIDVLVNGTKELVDYQAKIAKETVATAIGSLTVTTAAGNVFDATLEARQNLADAILASSFLGLVKTVWRLADNTELLVTLDELKEAHALALQAYAQAKAIGV